MFSTCVYFVAFGAWLGQLLQMPLPRVYVETTIPSFYYTSRHSPAMLEASEVTREWWERASVGCELLTGSVVQEELEGSPGPHRLLRLRLIEHLPVLGRDHEVSATVRELIRHKAMPAAPSLDAYHLGLASHSGCDLLVTWDRKHLANSRKSTHIRRILERLGMPVPDIVTPREHLRRMA